MSEPTPSERVELAINALQGFASGYMRENNAFDSSKVIADSAREALAALTASLAEAQQRTERAEGRLREISDLLEDAGVPGGTTIYGGVLIVRERAERAEAKLEAAQRERENLHRTILETNANRERALRALTAAQAEATALREALAKAEATLSALVVGTCPECGPVYRFDEDGCCTGCGHDVAFDSVEKRGGQPPTGGQ